MSHAEVAAVLLDMSETGPLTPTRVVGAAQDADHPLHDLFEWNDSHAAHQYRLIQARKLIVAVMYRPEGARRSIPVFVHVPASQGEGEYVPIEVAVRQPERWQLAREEALRFLGSAQNAIEEMEEALRIYGRPRRPSVDRAVAAVKEAREALVATGGH